MNIFEITLDVDKRPNKEAVSIRQGDVNGTTINATLRDHDVPMEGGDYTAAFCMMLPDRMTYYWTEATYENGVVSVVVDEQYAATVPGSTNNAYFELYEGDELKYTTASFVVRIKASAMDGEAAQSYDSRVEAIMAEMRELIDDETDSEEERKAAEEVRESNEQTRVSTFATNEAERIDTFETNEASRSETFTVNEGLRASTFAETEGARSTRFLTNEDERQQTFDDNEAARVSEYSTNAAAWSAAEAQRITTFNANEANRQSTFEANEADRQSTFEDNEADRQARFIDSFYPPSVSVEETASGQVAHITWKNSSGMQMSDMAIDDAINVTMTGDTFAIPVDPNGVCTESGTARFYFAGWVGSRMTPSTVTPTMAPDSRFTVRCTASTSIEMGLVRVNYTEGVTYPALVDVCTLSFTCNGRKFLHRIEAIAPRGGVAVDGVSPTVSIDDTATGHVVTITDVDGEHSYTVPTYAAEEAARQGAEDLRISAESDRAEAESERASAEIVRAQTVGTLSDKLDTLMTRGPEVEAEYLHRIANDGDSISGDTATITSIRGNTLVWNQAVPAFDDTWTTNAATTSYDQTTDTVTVTCASNNNVVKRTSKTSAAGITGHKYYMASTVDASHISPSANATVGFNSGSSNSGSLVFAKDTVGRVSGIVEATADSTAVVLRIPSNTATGDYVTYKDTIIIDLTRMFGAGNEPSTAEEFEALYPDAYYPYDTGSLLSVQAGGVETVGCNLLDKRTSVDGKYINASGGESSTSGTWSHSDFISVIPGKTYTFTPNSTAGGGAKGAWYASANASTFIEAFNSGPITITAPSGAHYVRLSYRTASYDMQFEAGSTATAYRPYWSQQRIIDLQGHVLRGLPDGTCDELIINSNGNVTLVQRVGIVTFDGSNESWGINSAGTVCYTNLSDAPPTTNANVSNIVGVCDKFEDKGAYTSGSGSVGLTWGGVAQMTACRACFNNGEVTTSKAAWTAWLADNPVTLLYPLATPVTYDLGRMNLSYHVEQGGTERIMVDETQAAPQCAPVPMSVAYDASLMDRVLMLPEDYISRASFKSFCDALAQAANLTIAETWNSAAQRYDYTIASNS